MTVKLSVIVPCYNEEKRFKSGFTHYYNFLKKQKYTWELILVNDGSSDKTLKLMKTHAKSKKNIKIVSYTKNQGKGYAVCQGIKTAKGAYVLFTDIDHSVPINTIASFYPYFEKGFQIVTGSRRVRGAKIVIHQNFFRETLGRGFTLLVRFLIDFKIRDATCGFKAFENKVAKKIANSISVYDWAFDAEILFVAKKLKLKLAQAPVAWSDVGGSKVSLKKDVLRSLFGLVKIRLNDLQGKYAI